MLVFFDMSIPTENFSNISTNKIYHIIEIQRMQSTVWHFATTFWYELKKLEE